jgi:UDP-glucose:(heptosyl)LPS alpha-1,3-glucosyltransferase
MRLAFCLFKYFPFGGLQRDFLRIAKACLARGHQIDVYTMQWDGEHERGLSIRILSVKGWRNHQRRHDFVMQVKPYLSQGQYDLVVGFNKMPGLDVYYAADTCYQAKVHNQRSWLYRLTERYRQTVAYEKAVFSSSSLTKILLISRHQQTEFMQYYHTPAERFHLLPPGIDPDRIAPANAGEIRAALRLEYNLSKNDFLLLMVGSGFKTKGVDRALFAFAALPENLKKRSHLFVIGEDNEKPFQAQAKKLKIAERVMFLGGRSDVPRFFLSADLLLHPAYNENTGTVLLEAIVAGLPVITTEVCGYAEYVQTAKAGIVLSEPFQQKRLNGVLADALLFSERPTWQRNAFSFAKNATIYSLPERAVSFIESLG